MKVLRNTVSSHTLALDERRIKFMPKYGYGYSTQPPAKHQGQKPSTGGKQRSQDQRNLSNRNEEDLPAKNIPPSNIHTANHDNTTNRSKKPREKPPQTLGAHFAEAQSETISRRSSTDRCRVYNSTDPRPPFGSAPDHSWTVPHAFALDQRSRRTVDLYKATQVLVDVDQLDDTMWPTACQTASSGKSARSLDSPRH